MTREHVRQAHEALEAAGTKPTQEAIHTTMDGGKRDVAQCLHPLHVAAVPSIPMPSVQLYEVRTPFSGPGSVEFQRGQVIDATGWRAQHLRGLLHQHLLMPARPGATVSHAAPQPSAAPAETVDAAQERLVALDAELALARQAVDLAKAAMRAGVRARRDVRETDDALDVLSARDPEIAQRTQHIAALRAQHAAAALRARGLWQSLQQAKEALGIAEKAQYTLAWKRWLRGLEPAMAAELEVAERMSIEARDADGRQRARREQRDLSQEAQTLYRAALASQRAPGAGAQTGKNGSHEYPEDPCSGAEGPIAVSHAWG